MTGRVPLLGGDRARYSPNLSTSGRYDRKVERGPCQALFSVKLIHNLPVQLALGTIGVVISMDVH